MVLNPEQFFAIFGKTIPENIAVLHELGTTSEALKFPWTLVVMLCGIKPVVSDGVGIERAFTRKEIVEKFPFIGEPDDVDGYVSPIEILWRKRNELAEVADKVVLPGEAKAAKMRVELTADEREVIESHGFSLSLFTVSGRNQSDMRTEMRWFYDRLVDMKALFEDHSVKSIARQALMNELQLNRIDVAIMRTSLTDADGVIDAKYKALLNLKTKLEDQYLGQWEQISKLCPSISASSNKRIVQGVISEFVEGVLKHRKDVKNELLDGVFTAFEIQVLMRHSVQMGMQYRPGWVAAVNEGKAFLSDPTYRRRLKNRHCRILDDCFHQAEKRLGHLIEKPDLESTHPVNGEYPPLFDPDTQVDEEDGKTDYKDFVDTDERPEAPVEVT